MRLRWTAQDLYSITRYIRRDSSTVAREVAKAIYDGCESLVNSPHRGRKGKQSGTRELVFSPLPYVVVYRVILMGERKPSLQKHLGQITQAQLVPHAPQHHLKHYVGGHF